MASPQKLIKILNFIDLVFFTNKSKNIKCSKWKNYFKVMMNIISMTTKAAIDAILNEYLSIEDDNAIND